MRHRTGKALSLLVFFLCGEPASAAFSQVTCPVAPAQGTVLLTQIGARDFDPRPQTPIGGATDYIFYQNGENPPALTILTNSNVDQLAPYFGRFETEACCDFLEVNDRMGSFQYKGSLNPVSTPEIAASRRWFPIANGTGAQSFLMKFFTDSSVANFRPPTFSNVYPSCKASQTTAAFNNRLIQANTRTDGLLLGNGDTIYVQVTQPANTHMVMTLDNKTGQPRDFDLYVSDSCAMPDDGCFLARGFSGSGSEALNIAAVNFTRTLFIGVHSFSGSGHFALNAMLHHPSQHMALNVCPVGFTPTSAQQAQITANLKATSALLLAGTNGNLFIHQYNMFANQLLCQGSCDICLNNNGTGFANGGPLVNHQCGKLNLDTGVWNAGAGGAMTTYHELGHGCFNLADDYTGSPAGASSNTICGHSVMNNSGRVRRFCSVRHCADGHSFSSSCNPSASGWTGMAGRIFYGQQYGNTVSATPNIFEGNTNLLNLVSVF